MLTAALDGLVDRFGLQGERLGEVVAGAVLKHSRDFNLTRECVLGCALSPETPAYDIQQACGTGLQAAIQVGRQDRRSARSTSASPAAWTPPPTRRSPSATSCARSCSGSTAPRPPATGSSWSATSARDVGVEIPQNGEPRTGLSMGEHAALTAMELAIGREDQDELAAASHQQLAAAYDRGFFDDLVTPFLGPDRDENLRPDSTVEKLATLKPVFGKGGDATMTAGNSTPLTDGASAVLLASEEWAAEHDLPVLAYLVDSETAAVDYVHGAEGLLMAPAYAMPRMLARNGLTLQDFDFYEIHEAFASQVLATLQAWEADEFCKERLGLDAPLGAIDRSQAQRQRLVAGGRPPVRRDRRPDRRAAGQACWREKGSRAAA